MIKYIKWWLGMSKLHPKFKKALEKLLKAYQPYAGSSLNVHEVQKMLSLKYGRWDCPLCMVRMRLNHSKCLLCPWLVFSSSTCLNSSYRTIKIDERIAQIKKWLEDC